ncbi:hydantoinase B/oxoprolinase family protein [Roseospira visakhapatnamensis]|uniref:5-oxoprolinase (ATP-hydrolyzing) n=1 Tax=Roseospira visakhapatnamensis TaxID=390880 RepID=A0A7W6WB63_9PROT|nr:hydantoinase B/oxoprolinase family protein [Roseospira visakhapatnamensis]MBB4267995.1 5-oxoprolinase (ATP-hydrolyzing) [Roseospira visakhapatnamensis]
MPSAAPDRTPSPADRWRIWIDRGGTFTDLVARRPDGALVTHKLLSENPERYADAALQGIRDLLGLGAADPIPADRVEAVKMGTTVATNALLERTGDRLVLVTARGFGDALRIGTQHRPDLFAREIVLPEMLYERVVEVPGRVTAEGTEITPLDEAAARASLQDAFNAGLRACAIVFPHADRFPDHEARLAAIAVEVGFTQVSASHRVSPLMKLVGRGDTTVVDAYLSPILRRYVDRVSADLGHTRLMFMQSNGGLTDAGLFQGKDAILSGPAGGVVGMARTAEWAGFTKLIGFDMGGTSTDVSHYDGAFERTFDTRVAGVRVQAPMMLIHTVAAGGGSILHYDGARFRVGPDSAGATPGPACYRRGGPLTVTDCNVMLGKLQPDHFPRVFGPRADQPLDAEAARAGFAALAARIGDGRAAEDVAEGFLRIAVENMANAIKTISIQRGYDVTEYALVCFGGAGGQHACLVADALGMTTVVLHPFAGVLSAYGMGLADVRVLSERTVEVPLDDAGVALAVDVLDDLATAARADLDRQGLDGTAATVLRRALLRVQGSDTPLEVPVGSVEAMATAFATAHKARFGFVLDKPVVIAAVSAEAIAASGETEAVAPTAPPRAGPPEPLARARLYGEGRWRETPVLDRQPLRPGDVVPGPALLVEPTGTIVVEPGWRAAVGPTGTVVLTRAEARPRRVALGTQADPVMLEVFNNLVMNIAEQMGATLQNTAHSVNIKERLDFSCAVFDAAGNLIANAPHMPVHLGSMSESVRAVRAAHAGALRPGDVYVTNAPYNGGTHLPDVTVVTPVFDDAGAEVLFFVGSRGHHADIGGITPGSMPPHSTHVDQEGVLLDAVPLVDAAHGLREAEITTLLTGGRYPARNPAQNLADLQAQIAANEKGVRELRRMVGHFGLDVVTAYMGHVQDNAEETVRRVLDVLDDGAFTVEMDDGARIRVAITLDKAARQATVDFTGTDPQQAGNFNAPRAVTRAAVLYVFRTLVDEPIPMNEGCLAPIDIRVPDGCLLSPTHPAAVVAGNVETSQAVVDCLYGALGIMAASQGTMNNLTFGNDRHQYYETLCGGAGAAATFDGASAVHTHMTNSRLTDPEVLESRFPVLVDAFHVRRGSGGAGQHRGGDGVVRRLVFREAMTVAILANRRRVPPFGMAGGADGAPGRTRIERADGTVEDLGSTGSAEVGPGDAVVIETPGGGGYGAP